MRLRPFQKAIKFWSEGEVFVKKNSDLSKIKFSLDPEVGRRRISDV
jgi:hypothetical protein